MSEKKKVLITNHYLYNRSGTELFTLDLSLELKKKNYDVFVFSPVLGPVADRIRDNGIKVSDNLIDFAGEEFDIIHAQHNTTAIMARSIFPKTPIIFMVHGVLPELEQPPSINIGISKFIAVSEEIESHLIEKYRISRDKICVIRNFVDLNKFYSKKNVNNNLKKVLVLSNHYNEKVREVVESACREMKIDCFHIGFPDNSVDKVEDYINDSDLVITLGRGVLESIACERNVIVYDIHGGDGFIDENNIYEIRKNNFSGRRFSYKYEVSDLKNEMSKYNPKLGGVLRRVIEKDNTAEVVIKKIENVYYECFCLENRESQISERQLFREIFFLEKSIKEVNKLRLFILQKERENEEMAREIQAKNKELTLFKSSKFWKLREIYLKTKHWLIFIFLNPRKFIKKYLNI